MPLVDLPVMSVTISAQKRCSVRLYLQLFLGEIMCYLRYLCLLANSGVQHILCCIFVMVSSVFILCCQFLWIVYSLLPLRYSVTFIYLCLIQPLRVSLVLRVVPQILLHVILSHLQNKNNI